MRLHIIGVKNNGAVIKTAVDAQYDSDTKSYCFTIDDDFHIDFFRDYDKGYIHRAGSEPVCSEDRAVIRNSFGDYYLFDEREWSVAEFKNELNKCESATRDRYGNKLISKKLSEVIRF